MSIPKLTAAQRRLTFGREKPGSVDILGLAGASGAGVGAAVTAEAGETEPLNLNEVARQLATGTRLQPSTKPATEPLNLDEVAQTLRQAKPVPATGNVELAETAPIGVQDIIARLNEIENAPPLVGLKEPVVAPSAEVAEEDKLPWWQDLALGGAAYGLAATGVGLAPVTAGASLGLTAVAGTGMYLAAKQALTGKPPTLEEIAKETAIGFGVMYAGPLIKGVEKVTRVAARPFEKALGPVVDQVWQNVVVRPLNVPLPGLKKSIAELGQPAVERLEKSLPMVAKTFRRTSAQKALSTEIGEALGKETRLLKPAEAYEVMKGLRGTPIEELTEPRAKEVLARFEDRLRETKLDIRYENEFRSNLSKLLTKPIEQVETALGPGEAEKILKSVEWVITSNKPKIKDIHNSLEMIIRSPTMPDEMKVLAKDLWSFSAKTAAEVADAARKASNTYLIDRLIGYRGLASSTAKPGYVESKYGQLKGLFVPKDVELELDALHKVPYIARSWYSKWLMGPWKTGKVILRTSTHMRNILSNVMLNDIGGLPFYRVDIYMKALKELRNNGSMWKEFSRATGAGGTFSQEEIYQLGAGLKYGATMFDKLYSLYDRVVAPVRGLYRAEESWFKLAKYMHNRELGVGKADAALDAMKWTLNYGEVTPFIAHMRTTLMPFATWYFKAIPLVADAAVHHPLRVAKWIAFGLEAQNYALQQVGLSEEEWKSIESTLPDYFRKGLYLMMPWRDDQGRLNLLNLTYVIPGLGDLSEFYQRSVPETLIQNPFVTLASTLLSKKKFSGAPLYYDWEEPGTKFAKAFAYAWEQMMPAPVPGGTDWNALYRSLTDVTGEAPSVEQTLAGLAGFKLSPIDVNAYARRADAIKRIHEAEMATQMKKDLKQARTNDEVNSILERYRRLREREISP